MIVGQLFALVTACCWAQNSIVYSLAGRRVGSVPVTHIRLWIALPAMMLIHLIFTGTVVPLGLTGMAYLVLGISGLLGFCVADLFIFRAFVDIGHRETLVILTLSPIFSTVISWVTLHERLAPLQLTGILVTVLGVAWVVLAESGRGRKRVVDAETQVHPAPIPAASTVPDSPILDSDLSSGDSGGYKILGFTFAVLGALAQAGGMVLAKRGIGEAVHPMSANLLRITAGLVGLILFRLLSGRFIQDFRKMRDTRALLLIGAGALVGPVLGIIMTLYALSLAPVGIVTTIMQTSPIILLPVDRFVFKKHLPVGAYAGTFLAVGGAVLLFV